MLCEQLFFKRMHDITNGHKVLYHQFYVLFFPSLLKLCGARKIFVVHTYKQLIFSIEQNNWVSRSVKIIQSHLILLGMLLKKVITHTGRSFD